MNEIELTQELIKIDSQNPPGNEKKIAFYIKDFIEDLAIPAELVKFGESRYNVIASIGKGEGLMFYGHMDTVPIGKREDWKYDPLGGGIIGGRIYGRGASDMKSGIAAVLTALKNSFSRELKRRVILVFTGDEEVGLKGSKYLLENRKLLFKGIKFGLAAEPTDLKLKVAQKGIVHLKFKFKGKATHASTPWKGDNAILKASTFIQEVNKLSKRLKRRRDPLLGYPTINVGRIAGGVKVNIVPEFCEVEIDRRLLPKETPQKVLDEFKDIVKKLKLKARIEQMIEPRLSMKISPTSEIVKLIRSIVKTKVEGEHGYSEIELYHRKLGIELAIFGPTNTAHTTNEYVKIADLKKARLIYEKVIKKWCF